MTITDAMIEAGATEIRLQLGSIGVFMSASTCSHLAKAALEAAERAASHEEPVWWQNRWRRKGQAWSEWEDGKHLTSLVLDPDFEGESRPLYTRPLPTPGEPDE